MRRLDPRVAGNLAGVVVATLVVLAAAAVRFLGPAAAGETEPVVIELPQAGGARAGQPVTVRGADVGIVRGSRLTREGVALDLEVRRGTPLPAAAVVQVLRRSPIGEQAVELTPVPADWEPPADGSRILASRLPNVADWPTMTDGTIDVRGVVLPASVPDVLRRTDELLTTVDVPSLVTVLDEVGTALEGRTDTFRELARDGTDLARTVTDAGDELERLLDSSEPVLDLVRDQRDALRSGLRSSTTLTDVLADRGDDLRTTLEAAPDALDELSRFLDEQAPNLSCLDADLLAVTRTIARSDVAQDLARLLDLNRFFFGSFDAGTQWDPHRPNAVWARIAILMFEQGTALPKEPRTPTPPTLPGAACRSPFGPGVDAVRQGDAQAPDATSPGIQLAPSLEGAGDRADHGTLTRDRP